MHPSKKVNKLSAHKLKYDVLKSSQVANDEGVAWQLLSSLNEVALMTLTPTATVAYANPFACKIFNLSYNALSHDYGSLPPLFKDHISDSISRQQTEFTLQYAIENQLRTLRVFVKTLTHTGHGEAGHDGQQLLYMYDTTHQVITESKLRQTEQLLQTLLDTSPDYICIKDSNNRWLKANQKFLNLFQIEADHYERYSNADIAASAHPVFRAALQYSEKTDEDAWQARKPHHHQEVVYQPQGKEKTLEVDKIAVFDEHANRQHLVTYAQDVSERKFVETQLQNRSTVLDALISCDWLLHSADSWHHVAKSVLQQSCLALRFTRAAILKHVHNTEDKSTTTKVCYQWAIPGFVVPNNSLEALNFSDERLIRWKETLQAGNPILSEVKELTSDERQLLKHPDTTCIAIVPLFVEKVWWGNIVIERCYDTDSTNTQELGSLMAIGRSLSIAIQRERAGKNLNLSKIAFDSATEGIMIIDTNGLIIGVNRSFTDITGYNEEEILGTTPVIFKVGKHELWDSLSTEGKWRGEHVNYRKNGDQYYEMITITVVKNQHNEITNYVGVFDDITEMKQSQNKLYELVNHDPLTGLPNRRLFNELFVHASKRAMREKHQIAILFIDLDRFKAINDSLGHLIGDKLLYEVSRRIKLAIREQDVVARLGGDEFLVMMDAIHEREHAARKAEQILQALQSEFLIDDKELFITASVGIAMFPNDGGDVDSVIKASDIAMYQVKNRGKNSYCFYNDQHSADVVERFNLENQLRRALERQQFEVYYQPQVSLPSGDIIGAEALVRWNHPQLGIVSPEKFVPLAEETGLILQIGEWVLTQAALKAKEWMDCSSSLKRIAVNVSGKQILQSNFADTVYGVLVQTDCVPAMLELEITESTVMQNTEHVINTFNHIKNLGVSLAIDDFGIGYSSLSNLKRLPLDKLKIDRSFVRDLPADLDDAAIAHAIYAMASSLGFSVIAEGVETKEQEAFLIEMGCTEAQGYLYSKPVTGDEFTQLLKQAKAASPKASHKKGARHAQ